MALGIQGKHEKMLYPCVLIQAQKAAGSGTVVYSKPVPDKPNEYETYILTNHHVVDDNIEVKEHWSPLLQRNVKGDVFTDVDIFQFKFAYGSWEQGKEGYKAQIVTYTKDQDMALLRLKSVFQYPYTADLYPRNKEKDLRCFMPVYIVGCGLAEPPFQTAGEINRFDRSIDNYEYWQVCAPGIFGNSGGACYLTYQDRAEFIGIPSRIAVQFYGSAVTHMMYIIPVTRVYDWLEAEMYQFIYDPAYTSKMCEEMRRQKREADERMIAMQVIRGSEARTVE
ncbi:MAG: serine protease [candidate division WOR-3 bacterium]